ncbi:MAG: flagellar hook-associated protein FlgL [Rhodoferax sp.]|uniref:flagellar hook-associated protein FlgL n=1 Tax=Rhodoferax sp. TaxID=50421 RepID=UPI002625CE66|nr:flagellar hook-associated protein FlgL [Rhodoferax sp.]MDD5335598.1 flagellar hook-associated protein FlgL [Rhodoferax sp.]
MRISTSSFYELSQTSMGSQQSNLLRVEQQLGAGSKILTPSDDPISATRALTVSQSIALGTQYTASRGQAIQTLSLEEVTLQNVTSVLQDVKTLVVQAGNGTISDADRVSIATALQSNLDQLQGLANTDDGNGQYLFAGFKSASPPFVKQTDGSILYSGDQGQRMVQVDVARQMAVTDDGRSIFQSVQGGAGYVNAANVANTGTGVFSANSVLDATDPNFGKDFSISFPSATSYQVDTVPPGAVLGSGSYSAGATIQFGGLQIAISGAPAAGDSFNVSTAQNAGADVFGALGDIIAALRKPIDSGSNANRAQLLNALSTANKKITNAHDNVLTVRSSIGSRLQELDALNTAGSNRTQVDRSQLSDLQDLDYATAISELYQRQTALQATQQAFVKIQKLSLFNFL